MSSQTHQKNFWLDLPRPFLCLAPMADVTDVAFRSIIAKYGKPDVMWTEFVSADGLFLRPMTSETELSSSSNKNKLTDFERIALYHGVGTDHPLLKDLLFSEAERPIVAQFFSKDPERMKCAGALAQALGFDGVDINMGCPADVICRQGAGAAMIKDPQRARELIRAVREGINNSLDLTRDKSLNSVHIKLPIPVSIKTRIGFHRDELDTWLPELLAEEPAVITIHARTKSDMSKVPARWGSVARAVEIRNTLNSATLIIGNGDVSSREEAFARAQETGCDGIMIGRGIFGNPWIFHPTIKKEELPLSEIIRVMLEHAKLFHKLLGTTKSFALMKKHMNTYLLGVSGTKELRHQLMQEGNSYEEVCRIVAESGHLS